MKNKILVLCAVMLLALPQKIYAQDIKINIEGNKCDISDYLIKDDRIYVPLRNFGNMFNLFVDWDQSQKTVNVNEIKTIYPNYIAYKDENGLYGYKDEQGNEKISPQYYYAKDFSEGMAIVRFQDKTMGFINMSGIPVIKDIFPETSFQNGIAVAIKILDDSSLPLIENQSRSDIDTESYYIDKAGNMLFDRYFVRAKPFSEGLACVQISGTYVPTPMSEQANRYSYIDLSGKIVTDKKYKYARNFEKGFAEVTTEDGVKGKIDKQFEFYPIDK